MNTNKLHAASIAIASLVIPVLVVLLASAIAHAASSTRPQLPWWENKPCASEDSVNCYWNAAEHGNGKGRSYFVRKFPDSRVCYVFSPPNAGLDYCRPIAINAAWVVG